MEQTESLTVPCEGSGQISPHGLCAMCGTHFGLSATMVPNHDRPDVLKMLERGDFDTTAMVITHRAVWAGSLPDGTEVSFELFPNGEAAFAHRRSPSDAWGVPQLAERRT